jgi:iron complex outermembrane receptor protein
MAERFINCRTYCDQAKYRLLAAVVQFLLTALILVITLLSGIASIKAHADSGKLYRLDIPSQNCAKALLSLSEATEVQVLYPYDIASQVTSSRVKGVFTLSQAIQALLKDTGLAGRLTEKGVITVFSKKPENSSKTINTGDTQMKNNKTLLAAAIAAVGSLFAAQGVAENDNHTVRKKSTSALIEEVFVTAQKKAISESVQDVPVAISAFSGEKIETMFAENLADIGWTAPNVSLTPLLPGVGNFVIRGMGTVGQSIPSSDPAVGIVVDGVSYGTIYGVLFDVFDLESVEVLRGPQGTLFGRNVTGGAVSVRTARPTDEFQGKVKATIGSHQTRNIMASVSGPLSDSWSAKLAILSKDHGDYWDNEFISGGHGEYESLVVRPAVRYQNDDFDITAIVEFGETEGDGQALRNVTISPAGRYAKAESTQDEKGNLDQEWYSLTVEANKELMGGTLTTVIGYRDLEQFSDLDIDGVPNSDLFHFGAGTGMEQDQFSIESRWAGNISDNVYLTAGIYYFEQEYDYAERRLVANAFDARGLSNVQHDTFALFGQANISLTDTLTLTLGGRFSKEEKDAKIGVIGSPNGTGDCVTVTTTPFSRTPVNFNGCSHDFEDKEDWSNFSPKVALDWRPSDNILLYASYTKGFRSGGYNTRFTDTTLITNPANPSSTPGPYDEETVDAYEIGMKSDWMDNRLRVNVAAFLNEYEDLQRTSLTTGGAQAVQNAAGADIQGVELEAIVLLTDSLALEASYGYTDAEYSEADFLEDATGLPAESFDFTMVPQKTASLALTLDTDLGDIGSLSSRLSYVFVDETVGDDFNRSTMSQYELYDASVTFTSNSDAIKIAVYGKNLKDEVYANFANSLFGVENIFLAPPRTYGVEFTYKF